MAITREKKGAIIETLEKILRESGTVVFVRFKGLSVPETTAMRKALKLAGLGYKVAKKTLLRRALASSKVSGVLPELAGELALAWGSAGGDPLSAPRGVHDFAKKHKDNIAIVGGIFGGRFVPEVEMRELATIPSREVLLSTLAFLLQSPLTRLAVAVGEIARKKAA